MSANSAINTFAKVLSAILLILLILGIAGALIYYFNRPQGLYILSDKSVITDNSDLAIEHSGKENYFTIKNAKGFGSYSVSDCVVKVVPNAGENHNFDFTVNGETHSYSAENDISAAFCKDYGGKSIPVKSDGTFIIETDKMTMTEILQAVYPDKQITMANEIGGADFGKYPYFALHIVSPDGKESVKIPFRYYFEVVGVELDKGAIIW